MQWLRPVAKSPGHAQCAPIAAPVSTQDHMAASRINPPRAMSPMPAQEALVPGDRLGVIASARPATAAAPMEQDFGLARHTGAHGRNAIPQFLLRH